MASDGWIFIIVIKKGESVETIYKKDNIYFNLGLITLTIGAIALIVFFIIFCVVEPIKGDEKYVNMPYKDWPWIIRLLRQVVPGIVLLTIISVFLINGIRAIRYKYLWYNERYDVVEGEVEVLSFEHYRNMAENEYMCVLKVSGMTFDGVILEKRIIEELKESSTVRAFYIKEKNDQVLWKIEKNSDFT